MGEMASSYSVAVSFRDMEWFIVLLPVMSVLPGKRLVKHNNIIPTIQIRYFPETISFFINLSHKNYRHLPNPNIPW